MRITTIATATAALALLPTTGATAVAPERFGIDESSDFNFSCNGTPTHVLSHEVGSGMIRHRGADGTAYFTVKYIGDNYLTNRDTGKTVHLHAQFNQHDQRITDNGDGTITLRYRGQFNETDYAPDGSVAFRTQGVDTVILVIDTNGTPANPDDDTTLTEDYLGFTGHNSRAGVDFCAWFADVTS